MTDGTKTNMHHAWNRPQTFGSRVDRTTGPRTNVLHHRLFTFPFLLFAFAFLVACDQMYDQPSVRPYEEPQQLPAAGAVAANAPTVPLTKPRARLLANPLTRTTDTLTTGQIVYRRHCWPCHGPRMDGQSSTVGPSFPPGDMNLLAPRVAKRTDGELFYHLIKGTTLAPALGETLTDEERWAVIVFLRDAQAQNARGEPIDLSHLVSLGRSATEIPKKP